MSGEELWLGYPALFGWASDCTGVVPLRRATRAWFRVRRDLPLPGRALAVVGMSVQLAVTHTDEQVRYYRVPEGEGWEMTYLKGVPHLVIGHGVPRVPLMGVRSYEIQECSAASVVSR